MALSWRLFDLVESLDKRMKDFDEPGEVVQGSGPQTIEMIVQRHH